MDGTKDSRLAALVADEAYLWGNDVAKAYHDAAQATMDRQWSTLITPFLDQAEIDYTTSIDFACGRGRNAEKLLTRAKRVIMIDVNPENIEFCEQRFAGNENVSIVQNDGTNISAVASGSASFLYSFDAMVHFDLELVIEYVHEFARVLAEGGFAFIHHSNYAANPGRDFRKNPGLRNFMSADIFKHVAVKSGFAVEAQKTIDWGGQTSWIACHCSGSPPRRRRPEPAPAPWLLTRSP